MIDTRLGGKNVLVTGGAGNIGAAVSRAFAAQGARVAIHHLAQDLTAPEGTEWGHITPRVGEAEIVPMGRLGEPEDIADAVVFLASHQARWITGQVLQVAGGHAL